MRLPRPLVAQELVSPDEPGNLVLVFVSRFLRRLRLGLVARRLVTRGRREFLFRFRLSLLFRGLSDLDLRFDNFRFWSFGNFRFWGFGNFRFWFGNSG